VQKIRRCHEDRWDFDHKDGAIWPMRVSIGGEFYGFCPGKVMRDPGVQELFKMMLVSVETGQLYVTGAIADQPDWFIDLLAWFTPLYDRIKFENKVRAVVGDGKLAKAAQGAVRTPKRNGR